MDGTLTIDDNLPYEDKLINDRVVEACKNYKKKGFKIVVFTSRNMRTYEGNVGKINVNTLPKIIDWLEKHDVPFDEVYVGKPWCGQDGFYVDDKAVRPSEFASLSLNEIKKLLELEKEKNSK